MPFSGKRAEARSRIRAKGVMRQLKIVPAFLFILFVCLTTIHALQQPSGIATLFEGARLITGDGSAPIENAAFVVVNNHIRRHHET